MSDDQSELLLEERSGKSCFEKPSLTCSLVWLIICILAIGLGVGIAILIMQASDKPPQVLTSCGMVEGFYDVGPDVHVYKGIPYARAPVDDLRWRRPVPLSKTTGTCWTGTKRAVNDHETCPHLTDGGEVAGDEDCLLLDIYSPSAPPDSEHAVPTQHPVAIWLDAGPLEGAAAVPPSIALTANTHIVYVNVQYRYGPLGFLVAEELKNNLSSNYGLWDQIEALRWIKENIKQFGGDPNQITLISQSSGSTAGLALLASPQAKGLFHRAWLMSGASVLKSTINNAKENSKALIEKMTCDNAKCLRQKSVKDILSAAKQVFKSAFITNLPIRDQLQTPMAVVDGELIPNSPQEAWKSKSGQYPDVPLLIGSIAELSISDRKTESKLDDFTEYVLQFLDTFDSNLTAAALQTYNFTVNDTALSKLAQLVSDIRLGCPLDDVAADAAAALNSSVYRYVVTNRPSSRSFLNGNDYETFGWDSYAFFEKEGFFLEKPATDRDLHFAHTIQQMGLSFIKTGTPGEAGWGTFPKSSAEIDDHVVLKSQRYHKKQCEFWATNGLLEYGWVN